MREIKFRAWDKQFNEMRSHNEIFAIKEKPEATTIENHITLQEHFRIVKAMLSGTHHFPLMQYTGLKDKNGKEIWESDCLDDLWEVFWGTGKYILTNISNGDILECNEKNTQLRKITCNRYEPSNEYTKIQKKPKGFIDEHFS